KEFFENFVASNALGSAVFYRSGLYGEHRYEAFKEADVLLAPSFSEAYPLTLLEAYSCGVPVVATSVGGCKSLVGSAQGRLVSQERNEVSIAEHFADAILALVKEWNVHKSLDLVEHFYRHND